MAVDYGEDDVDALDFEQSSTVGSVNVANLKSWKEQSKYFERRFRAGSRTRDLAQA